jgi:arginine/ornithine N-succinyltransferase beta subunit
VIYKVILSRLHTTWCAKVHSVRFARALNLFVAARQANELRVKLFQVLLQNLRVVARGVACDHEREEYFAALLNHLVVHEGHFVEFVRADIGAVGETEVDLQGYKLTIDLML